MILKPAARVLLILFFCAVRLAAQELHIVASCDLHGNLSKFARLLPEISEYKDAVKLDLGDIFQGDPLCDLSDGTPMIDALNIAEYDFFIPGNHEFELSSAQLGALLKRFNGIVLGQWRYPGIAPKPWQLFERNGFRLAIIGMTDNGIYRNRRVCPDLKIISELDALKQTMAEIRSHKVDAVILARHGGNYFSGMPLGRLLRQYPEIKLVICGHSHKEIAGQRSGKTLIVQPGAHGTSAAVVTLKKIRNGELFISSKLIRPRDTADKKIVSLHTALLKRYAPRLSETVLSFSSSKELIERYLNLLCSKARADRAVLDLPDLPPGTYTRGALLKRFPYRNMLVKVQISPAEFAAFAKEKAPAGRKRFITPAAENKEKFTLVLDTFQFTRSKALKYCRDIQIIPVLSREILLKDICYEKTIHHR